MISFENKDFLKYMPDVLRCDKSISTLNDQWDNIKLLCEINCPTQANKILHNMSNVQQSFYTLQQQLIDTLIRETLEKMKRSSRSKAQVAIDILIRNLYERTADVGFIATDNDIRKFVVEEKRDSKKEYIRGRLRDYVAKYTVYDEIILLDREFTVLLNLDESNQIIGQKIAEGFLEQISENSFHENYDRTLLRVSKNKVHVFSSKILDDFGCTAGFVCLCFKLEDEIGKIFQRLSHEHDGSVILIIDEHNKVLASSDENHVPVGLSVEDVNSEENSIVYYRGLEYITHTVKTKGYQGYFGLGWKACIMVPLDLAFKEKKSGVIKKMDSDMMTELMSQADSFSQELQKIVIQTEIINHSLKQIVFNGQVMAHEDTNEEYARMRPILNTIGKIGVNTSQLFEQSIKNLFATVISSNLQNAGFLASLCVNIMDRNLYERSDDCRWWALNPTFKKILAKGHLNDEDTKKITQILQYINSLYTVYSNLFVFDKTGVIVAVSNPARTGDIGRKLDGEYVHRILTNNKQGKYYVSDFQPTDLYDGRATYIYGASITDVSASQNTVGGIGIVFDSESQFVSMLNDAIDSQNAFAVFAQPDKRIISTTSADLQIGDLLVLPDKFFAIENGTAHSEIISYNGCYYAVGCACSSSYREYKEQDGYKNDVLAFIFDKLADVNAETMNVKRLEAIQQSEIMLSNKEEHVKLATFFLNNQVLALDQGVVLEAMDSSSVFSVPGSIDVIKGAILYNNRFIAVIDTRLLLGITPVDEELTQLLIIKLPNESEIALQIDELSNVIEINKNDVKQIPQVGGPTQVIKGIFCVGNNKKRAVLIFNSDVLLQVMNLNMPKDAIEKTLRLAKEICNQRNEDKAEN